MPNPYDCMFEDEQIIKKYINGQNRYCVGEKFSKYNNEFQLCIISLKRKYNKLLRYTSFIKNLIVTYSRTNGVNVKGRINNLFTMLKSFQDEISFFKILSSKLEIYPLLDKSVIQTIKRFIKKKEERIDRIKNIYLKDYFQLIGFSNYIIYLEENGTNIYSDMDKFFNSYNISSKLSNDLDKQEKDKLFIEESLVYYNNVCSFMKEHGIQYEDLNEKLSSEEEAYRIRCKKVKEEKLKQNEQKWALAAKAKFDDFFAVVTRGFLNNEGIEYHGHTIGIGVISNVIDEARKLNTNEIYIICLIKIGNSKNGIKYWGKNNEITKSLSFLKAQIFYNKSEFTQAYNYVVNKYSKDYYIDVLYITDFVPKTFDQLVKDDNVNYPHLSKLSMDSFDDDVKKCAEEETEFCISFYEQEILEELHLLQSHDLFFKHISGQKLLRQLKNTDGRDFYFIIGTRKYYKLEDIVPKLFFVAIIEDENFKKYTDTRIIDNNICLTTSYSKIQFFDSIQSVNKVISILENFQQKGYTKISYRVIKVNSNTEFVKHLK